MMMSARTNFLWTGDLVSQVVAIVVSMMAIMVLLPHLLAGSRDLPAFAYFTNVALAVVTLLNVFSCLGRWERTKQRVAAVTAHRGQALVCWRYDQQAWQAYAQAERRRAYMYLAKWSAPFLFVGAFVLYMLLQAFGSSFFWPLLSAMGVNLLVVLVRVGILPYYRIRQTVPTAIITPEGLCIGGCAYFWRQGDATLDAITLRQGLAQVLEFKLRVQQGRRAVSQTVYIPVPLGHGTEAATTVAALAPK